MKTINMLNGSSFYTILIGLVLTIFGGIYTFAIDIAKNPTPSVLAVDDAWIRFLGTYSHRIAVIGIALLMLGSLYRLFAKRMENVLEKTNRSVSYDTLVAKRSARR